jgi:lipopolysaccharide transport system permease protein
MGVFTIVFGRLAHLGSDGLSSAVFYYVALLLWTYFSNAVSLGSSSVVDNQGLVTKIYFPRLFLPTAPVIAGLLDFAVASVLLIPLMIVSHQTFRPTLLLLPAALILVITSATGISLALAAVNTRFRDVRLIVPFGLQLGLFISPIAYSSQTVPRKFGLLYHVNPIAGAVDLARWCVDDRAPLVASHLAVSVLVSVTLLVFGIGYFARADRSLADVV